MHFNDKEYSNRWINHLLIYFIVDQLDCFHCFYYHQHFLQCTFPTCIWCMWGSFRREYSYGVVETAVVSGRNSFIFTRYCQITFQMTLTMQRIAYFHRIFLKFSFIRFVNLCTFDGYTISTHWFSLAFLLLLKILVYCLCIFINDFNMSNLFYI